MYRSFIFCLTKTKVPGVFKQLDKTLHNPHIRYRRSFPFLFSRLFFSIFIVFFKQFVKLENPIPNEKEKAKTRKYFVYKGIAKRCEVSDKTSRKTSKKSRRLMMDTDI